MTSIDNVLGAMAARIRRHGANNDQMPAAVRPDSEPGALIEDD